jgi:hypothetical protein
VTEGTTGSTVPRRQLGRYLRDLRNQARLTVRAAAVRLEWSEAKIWRIETGQTALRSLDVEAMCKIYGAPAQTAEGLMALAKETKARGWWLSYSDVINEDFNVYIGLEEAASQLQWYESELVPGLLQTEDYARTLIGMDNPGLEKAEVERRVQLRIKRQALLVGVTRPPVVNVVLNEAVLRRPVGGRKVMAAQLEQLVEMSRLDNLTIRVMPFDAGIHYGAMSGSFVKLDFPTNGNGAMTEPPVVYVDGFTGALYLDKPHEIERYDRAFSEIWAVSLGEDPSMKFIEDAMREMASE